MGEHLFQLGNFTLHSGASSNYKIECDALTEGDWECVAALIAERLPPVGSVHGVPRGGFALARAFVPHLTVTNRVLIVDDVLTSGGSMGAERAMYLRLDDDVIGAVLFARGPCPDWITPLFSMTPVRA